MNTAATERAAAALAILLNAFTWGLSWLPFRWLRDAGLHGLWATAAVFTLSVAIVTITRPGSWRSLLGSPWLMLLAVAAGCTNAAFNTATTVGEVVRVVLLFYLMPVWSAILARLMLGAPITPGAVLRIALGVGGATVILMPEHGGWPRPQSLGDWLGLAAGLSFALVNVMLRKTVLDSGPARSLAMFAGSVVIPAAIAVVLGHVGLVAGPPALAWGWVAGTFVLGVIFYVANYALQYGAARLPADAIGVILITEVIFATASAVMWGDETLTARKILGGVMILTAALLAALPPGPRRGLRPRD